MIQILTIIDVKLIVENLYRHTKWGSTKSYELDSLKKLKNLSNSYKEIPIIVMHTIEDGKFLKEPHEIKIERDFKPLFLLALPRTKIRQVVSEYSK